MITIFTSTYNRAYCLPRLYESLLSQTNHNFIWLIINDGSNDETSELVDNWMKANNPFEIRYIEKKSSGGLQRAINDAYQITSGGGYMLKIDSDDYLLPHAVEKVLSWIDEADKIPNCIGIGALYQTTDGILLCDKSSPLRFKNGVIDANYFERHDYGLGMDTIEAYNIEIRKKYPIPIWNSEKHGPERVAFCNMSNDGYFIRWHDEVIAVVDYQKDGISDNFKKANSNPMSQAISFNYYSSYKHYNISQRIKYGSEFVFYSILGHNISYLKQAKAPALMPMCVPIGFLKFFKRRMIPIK